MPTKAGEQDLIDLVDDPNPLSHRRASYIERVSIQRERKKNRRSTKPFSSCHVCDRSFASRNQLIQHFGGLPHKKRIDQQKQKDKQYTCAICERSFPREHDLESHKKGKSHRSALRRRSNISK